MCGSLYDATWPKWSLLPNVACSTSFGCRGSASANVLLRTANWATVGALAGKFSAKKGT